MVELAWSRMRPDAPDASRSRWRVIAHDFDVANTSFRGFRWVPGLQQSQQKGGAQILAH